MNFKKFKKEFAGAPYGVSLFAELLLGQLDEPKPGAKSTADTIAAAGLRLAAERYLAAEQDFAEMLVAYGIDLS